MSEYSGSEPFAGLLGDDLIDEAETLLTTTEVQQKTGGSVIALIEVGPLDGDRRRGLRPREQPCGEAGCWRSPVQPGRHWPVRASTIRLRRPEEHGPGHHGESQLTDALQTLAAERVEFVEDLTDDLDEWLRQLTKDRERLRTATANSEPITAPPVLVTRSSGLAKRL